MPDYPKDLRALLDAKTPEAKARAWDAFIRRRSDILMETARRVVYDLGDQRGYDRRMDAYTFILRKLRDNDFAKLRKYEQRDGATFEGWLATVARNFARDWQRTITPRIDRKPSDEQRDKETLQKFLLDDIDAKPVADERPGADAELLKREMYAALDGCLASCAGSDVRVFIAMCVRGMTAKAVAELFGLATQWHAFRAFDRAARQLRDCLATKGFERR